MPEIKHKGEIKVKRLLAVLLAIAVVFAFAACGNKNDEVQENLSVGHTLLKDFEERAESENDVTAIAEGLLENEVIGFMGGAMEVEPGFLTGFGEYEVADFEKGAMFAPMIGTIPFVGYVFELADGTDAEGFIANLEANADLRWNICTEADEMVSGSVGDKVFFVMSPVAFDEAE